MNESGPKRDLSPRASRRARPQKQPDIHVKPIAEGLAQAWSGEMLGEMAATGNFSFRGLTREFNKLLYLYPIRVPERFSLVIRALLTQENICLTLDPNFNFLEAAFPYVARRLLTDPDPNLRMRLLRVVIVKGRFEWDRLAELIKMAEIGAQGGVSMPVSTMVSACRRILKDASLGVGRQSGAVCAWLTERDAEESQALIF